MGENIGIIISIASSLIAIGSFFGLNVYFQSRASRKAEREKEAEQSKKEAARKQRIEEIRDVVREENAEIANEISELKSDLNGLKTTDEVQRAAMQSVLKDRLYQLHKHCMRKGSATNAERENFESMYNSYHTLGKNGVMDSVRLQFLQLPIKE